MGFSTFLAENSTALRFDKLWEEHGSAHEKGFILIQHAKSFDTYKKQRIEHKVGKFLNTSFRIQSNPIQIKLAVNTDGQAQLFKQGLRKVLFNSTGISTHHAKYILSKTHIFKTKTPLVKDLFPSHIMLAKEFSADKIAQLSTEQIRSYRNFEDVHLKPIFAHTPLPMSQKETEKAFEEHAYQWICHFSNNFLLGKSEQDIPSFATRSVVLGKILQDVNQFFSSCHLGVEQKDADDFRAKYQIDDDEVACTIDKNEKCIICMSKIGFLFRLHEGFDNPDYYLHLPKMSRALVANIKQSKIEKFVPPHFLPYKTVDSSVLQYVYHNYKGKCLPHPCKKQHEHVREICSDVLSTTHDIMQKTAQCVRWIKSYQTPGWDV